jgi:hypothetical protein
LNFELLLDCNMIPYRRSWREELKADVKRGEARK